jgi:hypothetical protein
MPPGQHARLGASSAHRWMVCHAAPRLEAQMPDETSPYAIEGTAAHNLAEICLCSEEQPREYVGTYMPTNLGVDSGDCETVEVTQEMADAVQVYVDFVRREMEAVDSEAHFELPVSLEALDPPEPMFGTADAVIWQPAVRTLIVADLKYGQGVIVEPENNPQLMYYALGAVLKLRVRPEQILVAVVQPRAEHEDGPIRTHMLSWDDLLGFKELLMKAAWFACREDNEPGPVGKWCRFCKAKAICPAQRSNALVVAQQEFDADLPTSGLPAPQSLDMDQITEVLEKAPYAEEWFNSVREYARRLLEQGQDVPGYNLVAKRAIRRWANELEAEKYLRSRKVKVADIFSRKIVSPAQAEKLTDLPDDMIVAQSSGYNLAPASNPRPAITPGSSAADEFEAIES